MSKRNLPEHRHTQHDHSVQDLSEFGIETDPKKLNLPEFIDRSELVRNRAAYTLLQFIGWAAWMWCIIPMITLIFWVVQFYIMYREFGHYSLDEQLQRLEWIAFAIIILDVMFLIWAGYNWLRFRNYTRRQNFYVTPDQQFSHKFNVDVEQHEQLQHHKIITLHHNDHGEVVGFDLNPLLETTATAQTVCALLRHLDDSEKSYQDNNHNA
ncbi:poly-beta-1,6-N-acetyl-D-glucosamine biosynthesis protein PgaD [Acinetobacter marinus]|uniref:Poly-beta-1,6-N-acetyl-D-glucosamine biosynthesis protein PgaD n=1 Tax=Acinetobacter marinus TaxID=281375 RepID=A0A1G6GXR3_9GAMM|nr:poly-beta-1,6-N-acetyl-D-glucosamine biosynthesis protein PgaD [Acinetobacter marinus]SDB86802.1 poly-beta-1,6-N-acetyl-D-glucosamine biosynthesis protein PgaD [Acinetobacter marinus]